MRTSWHQIWGCAHGPLTRAAPQIRLVSGSVVFAACMIASCSTVMGSLVAVGTVAAWLVACRPPWRILAAILLLGLVLFLPCFLLLPLLPHAPSADPGSWRRALVVPWTVLLRGLCGMLVCSSTVTTLSASDLREGLMRLPVPGVVSAILLQIVHQTATLFYETRRVASAMALRGATGGRLAPWRVLCSLPQVWLPRVIDRAERVGAAMDLRGYCDGPGQPLRGARRTGIDTAALVLATGLLALAITIRLGVA